MLVTKDCLSPEILTVAPAVGVKDYNNDFKILKCLLPAKGKYYKNEDFCQPYPIPISIPPLVHVKYGKLYVFLYCHIYKK